MSSDTLHKVVRSYLQAHVDAPVGVYPEPSNELTETLRASAEESFAVIMEFIGDKIPDNIDPRDIDIPVGLLLTRIADLVPTVIIDAMHDKESHFRSMFIYIAAESKASMFVPQLLGLLSDRSRFIKNCVLDLISQWPHLQVQEAVPILEKLSKQKSFQSDYDRQDLDKARAALKIST